MGNNRWKEKLICNSLSHKYGEELSQKSPSSLTALYRVRDVHSHPPSHPPFWPNHPLTQVGACREGHHDCSLSTSRFHTNSFCVSEWFEAGFPLPRAASDIVNESNLNDSVESNQWASGAGSSFGHWVPRKRREASTLFQTWGQIALTAARSRCRFTCATP